MAGWVGWWITGGRRVALALCVSLALAQPGRVSGQTAVPYMDFDALTSAVRGLQGDLAEVSSLATTEAGRDVWLVTVGSDEGRALDQRPALLVVANIEANRVAGSSAAYGLARRLVDGYGTDAEITRLLDTRTIYIVPRANPDGAELVFDLPGVETPYKPFRGDAARGGLNAAELGRDLNGDGMVTLMRVARAGGSMMQDPDDPRIVREANRARGERGVYDLLPEGIHPDSVDAYLPLGGDGVNLNLNFQHEYQYFEPHVGPHMISEVESKALADFVYEHPNVAAVMVWSAYDNLRSPTPANRRPPPAVTGNPPDVPTNLTSGDRPYFEYVSEVFGDVTGLDGAGADGEGGSFPQFTYYQMGLPTFTTPIWAPPAGSGSEDARWLALFDSVGMAGHVPWAAATHPQLGNVEVGGFVPNARVNPPESELDGLVERHIDFAVWLAGRLPEVEVVEASVEARGQGIWSVSVTLANPEYFPTQLELAERIRFNRPISVRMMPASGVTVLSEEIQHRVTRIEGMGGIAELHWLVEASEGSSVTIEVFAERAGGVITVPVTLTGGDE